jgi:hypothetical protein
MSLYWNGVEKAINDFFADKPERFIPNSDKIGHYRASIKHA